MIARSQATAEQRPAGTGATPARTPADGQRAGGGRRRLADLAVLALPAAATLFFAFNAGGFFVGAPAAAAVVLLVIAAGRVLIAEAPLAGVSRPMLLTAGLLSAFAAWTLASAFWSGAPARAMIEFDRVLLYLGGMLVLGAAGRRAGDLETALRLLAGAFAAICVVGLVTRTLPDVWSAPANIVNERLSYPVTYWNTLGVIAGIGLLLCVHLASGPRSGRIAAALGAAAAPPLAATLVLTFSRGAVLVTALSLVAYVLLARSWRLVPGLLASLPAAAIAAAAAYGAEALATPDPATPVAVAQGQRLMLVVLACALAAAGVRLALAWAGARTVAERRLAELSGRAPRAAARLSVAGIAIASVVAALAAGLPDQLGRQLDRFRSGSTVASGAEVRERLTDPGSNGRVEHWQVALEGLRAEPLHGEGAGTFALQWAQRRDTTFTVLDAHSLYLEVAAELGLVGLLLLAGALLVIVAGVAAGLRGADRATRAALFAALVAWLMAAGIDWHWEMPVVTFWVFAVGGLALARRMPAGGAARGGWQIPPLGRVIGALALLVIAVNPALALLSQRSLEDALAAFRRGDCERTIDRALASTRWLGVRPEPFELIGFCDVRLGEQRLAVRALENAVERDPRNWEMHYGLALVRAAAGRDPRPALREARRLNPRSELVIGALDRFAGDDPRKWRRGALTAPLPLNDSAER